MSGALSRKALTGLIHQAASRLNLEGSSYRAMLMCLTGQWSCHGMNLDELHRLLGLLNNMVKGVNPDAPSGAVMVLTSTLPPAQRPTAAQWSLLGELAGQMGWQDWRDERLLSFMARTTSCSRPEKLTRHQASLCITGLMRWRNQLRKKLTTDPQQERG